MQHQILRAIAYKYARAPFCVGDRRATRWTLSKAPPLRLAHVRARGTAQRPLTGRRAARRPPARRVRQAWAPVTAAVGGWCGQASCRGSCAVGWALACYVRPHCGRQKPARGSWSSEAVTRGWVGEWVSEWKGGSVCVWGGVGGGGGGVGGVLYNYSTRELGRSWAPSGQGGRGGKATPRAGVWEEGGQEGGR